MEKVTGGTRLALTVAFTCDPTTAIDDFLGRALADDEDSEAEPAAAEAARQPASSSAGVDA